MLKNWIPVICCATISGLVGLVCYCTQADLADPLMNEWSLLAFTSMGASLGCLLSEPHSL